MNRSILALLVLASTLTGCGTVQSNPVDVGSESTSGGTYGYLPGGSSTTTDSGDADADIGTDTDAGTTDNCKVSAKVGITPKTEWDPSVTSPATANPEFHLWYVGNDTTGNYDKYGVDSDAKTASNGYITVDVEYCPGNVLVIGGDFFDGHRDRWLTEAGGVVNLLPDSTADNAERVILSFSDGSWQGYRVGGDDPEMGEAGWVSNGGGGGDLFVATFDDTKTHDDR